MVCVLLHVSFQLNTVVPTSHCWTNQATIYIGCQGGQLLLTDFESGTTKVLTNPAILQVS